MMRDSSRVNALQACLLMTLPLHAPSQSVQRRAGGDNSGELEAKLKLGERRLQALGSFVFISPQGPPLHF